MSGIDALYPEIGRVVASFAQLEGMTLLFVTGLVNSEQDITMALLSEAPFSRRLDALMCVAPYRIADAALLSELKELIRHMSQSEVKRNVVVHTVWAVSGSSFASFKPTARRKTGFQTNLKNTSIDEITTAGDHVRHSISLLNQFMQKLQKEGILKVMLSTQP